MQKVAFEVAGGINRTTPVTVNSLVTLALLGVRDRALTLDEVRAVVAPVRSYLDARDAPQGEVQLLDREGGLAQVLAALTDAGVVTTYSGGDEAVYSIQPGQHLVAAFYRNSGIHWFVNRSILELAVLFVHEHPSDNPVLTAWYEAKKLRDLLKFEFFFPDRDTFESELRAEVELLVPEWEWGTPLPTEGRALNALVETGLFMSHRTLRSFFDAQLVVAERLARRSYARGRARRIPRRVCRGGSADAVARPVARFGVRILGTVRNSFGAGAQPRASRPGRRFGRAEASRVRVAAACRR